MLNGKFLGTIGTFDVFSEVTHVYRFGVDSVVKNAGIFIRFVMLEAKREKTFLEEKGSTSSLWSFCFVTTLSME